MGRELNPEIFGENSSHQVPQSPRSLDWVESASSAPSRPQAPTSRPQIPSPQLNDDFRSANPDFVSIEEHKLALAQIEVLKRKFKEGDAKIEMLSSRISELISGIKIKFDRLTGQQSRSDDYLKKQVYELTAQVGRMNTKLNEKRGTELKVEELIDRHNQTVQSFEAKLSQMQRLISEQEMQVTAARSEMKEHHRLRSRGL